jgi:hypothetical protein
MIWILYAISVILGYFLLKIAWFKRTIIKVAEKRKSHIR